MRTFSSKIAFSIIAAGLFVVSSFVALNYEHLTSPFYVVSGLLVAFVLLFGCAMGNNYSLPVRELLKEADMAVKKATSKNHLQSETKDEVEQLSKAFNVIVQGLSQKSSDMETFKKSSDIKFKTKDIVSEKVIDVLEEKVKNRTVELERVSVELERTRQQLALKEREVTSLTQLKKKKKNPRLPS